MKHVRLSIVPILLALAACGADSETAGATASATDTGTVAADAAEEAPVSGPEQRILAFGNSLFAGYNLEPSQAYPQQLEAALRAQGVNARVTNAGVSGDTTAAGLQRLQFTLDSLDQPPTLAIIELGGNDLLRQLSPQQTRDNLSQMLDILDAGDIPVLLMGMRAPPNYGPEFVDEFDRIYADLARQYEAALVPFFLEAIYDQPQLIQDDRIHPTAEGIETLVNDTVDDVVEALPEIDEAEPAE